ncbi:MAG: DUF4250 domain-containing protein [Muribaculaceae bacterium]|nr:DUF4250 domain-containing protein [Muribaculaceae bacterium]MDE6835545.1 DUF4250 domain-containing protein [Muribaculaceae bacterium]MDE6867354.1 DUF4250 domain-containing protein [Muribaculaceae bacterium]
MELPQDPFMLLSMINMKLRDEYSSLDDLCKSEDIDINILSDKLKNAGFDYMPEINQFR